MKKSFIPIFILIILGCTETSNFSDKQLNLIDHVKLIRKIEFNGYDKNECINGRFLYTDHYYKLVFNKPGYYGGNHFFVTKYAYSCRKEIYNMKDNHVYVNLKHAVQSVCVYIYTSVDKDNFKKAINPWLICDNSDFYFNSYDLHLFGNVFTMKINDNQEYEKWLKNHPGTLFGNILMLKSEEYIDWMKYHPETQILNY